MGMNISPFLCQWVTDAIKFMYEQYGFDLVNYLDDLATAEVWDLAAKADDHLGQVIKDSGLEEKEVKHWHPNYHMIFLGVFIALTLSVMQERIQEMQDLLELWMSWGGSFSQTIPGPLRKTKFYSCMCQTGPCICFSHHRSHEGPAKNGLTHLSNFHQERPPVVVQVSSRI